MFALVSQDKVQLALLDVGACHLQIFHSLKVVHFG